MTCIKLWISTCLCFLFLNGVQAEDVSALREAAKACQGQGLKSLIGYSCWGTKFVYANNGSQEIVHQQTKVRGSFRSETEWFVLRSQSSTEDRWEAVLGRNGRLVFRGTELDSPNARMGKYGFSEAEHEEALFSAETYFSSITSGGNLFDVSFYFVTQLDGFSARRVPGKDATEIGRCWEWSTEMKDDVPAYVGEIWIREFGNNVHAIGKLNFQVRGSEKSVQIRNVFSSNPDSPSLIQRVEIDRRGQRELFVIDRIESENEPPNGYSPEAFGLTTPVDPAGSRMWLWVAASVFAGVAVYLTIRYRRSI